MILHYMGKYSGDPSTIPHGEHRPGAVKFRGMSQKKYTLLINLGAAALYLVTLPLFFWESYLNVELDEVFFLKFLGGALLSVLLIVPHEILHGLGFKGDVYLYHCLRRGMLFVTGPEDMSRGRYILMNLLPNIVFGFIPFTVFLFFPSLTLIGALGAVAIPSGFGDYRNVVDALIQMPKGSRTYLYGLHSYWYIP